MVNGVSEWWWVCADLVVVWVVGGLVFARTGGSCLKMMRLCKFFQFVMKRNT